MLTDAAPFLLFCGPLHLSHGAVSGWEPMGRSGVVTSAEGHLVRQIDGAPAIEFFARYLGDMSQIPGTYAEYPMIVRNEDGEKTLIAVVSVDSESGEVTCFGAVPEGAEVWISEADRDMILGGTDQSIEAAIRAFPGDKPSAVMIFSCASRKAILGTRAAGEADRLAKALPDIPMAGFYTYGEIAPARAGAPAHFHNSTFVTVLLGPG